MLWLSIASWAAFSPAGFALTYSRVEWVLLPVKKSSVNCHGIPANGLTATVQPPSPPTTYMHAAPILWVIFTAMILYLIGTYISGLDWFSLTKPGVGLDTDSWSGRGCQETAPCPLGPSSYMWHAVCKHVGVAFNVSTLWRWAMTRRQEYSVLIEGSFQRYTNHHGWMR
jgi:hypothetical protein